MEELKRRTLTRVLNLWVGYNLFLVFASRLPHMQVPALSWANTIIYVLLFILCVVIARKDGYNRDIFSNLALLFLIPSIGPICLFVGDDYLFGSNSWMYQLFLFRKVGIATALALFTVYTTFKYLFPNLRTTIRYSIVGVLLFTLTGLYFGRFLLDVQSTIEAGLSAFYTRLMYVDLLSLAFVGLYGFALFKYDRPNGKYINALVMMCLIVVSLELLDMISKVYKFYVFKVGLYILTLNLIGFAAILLKKYNLCYSEYGKFYEQLVHQGQTVTDLVLLQDEKGQSRVTALLAAYFRDFKNWCIAGFLLVSFVLNVAGVSFYLQLNLAVAVFVLAVLSVFVYVLYDRRSRRGNVLLLPRE